jgi:hypothetical protein
MNPEPMNTDGASGGEGQCSWIPAYAGMTKEEDSEKKRPARVATDRPFYD